MNTIRRRIAVAATIVGLTGLAGIAYTAGHAPPPKPPLAVASAHGSQSANLQTRASQKPKKHRRVVASPAPSRPKAIATRSSHGKHGRGREHESRDDVGRTGVDA